MKEQHFHSLHVNQSIENVMGNRLNAQPDQRDLSEAAVSTLEMLLSGIVAWFCETFANLATRGPAQFFDFTCRGTELNVVTIYYLCMSSSI